MVYVSIEESKEIIHKFIKYAFDEMSSDRQWETRRNELIEQQYIPSLEHDVEFHYTFQEICELNHEGDTDVGLIMVFVRVITSKIGEKWLEAWVYENYPALDRRADGIICWDMWGAMDKILNRYDEELVYELKDILELNLSLK
jgi:hypothetical protein